MTRRFDFAVGRTNPETFPVDKMQRAASIAIEREYEALTNYHGRLGHPELRQSWQLESPNAKVYRSTPTRSH